MPAAPSRFTDMTRRSVLGGAAAGAALAPSIWAGARAQALTPAPLIVPGVTVNSSDTLATIDLRDDPYGRITTQVMLNDQGPFRFFVDTGANRSALSAATALRVGAIPTGDGLGPRRHRRADEAHGDVGIAEMRRVRAARRRRADPWR
ncbi:MAG: retroviral-like aspartic protease family protein [Alphaproteobacteria bacterium]